MSDKEVPANGDGDHQAMDELDDEAKDECILLDDGFSVVDYINIAEENEEEGKEDGTKVSATAGGAANTTGIVSDKEEKKTEETQDKSNSEDVDESQTTKTTSVSKAGSPTKNLDTAKDVETKEATETTTETIKKPTETIKKATETAKTTESTKESPKSAKNPEAVKSNETKKVTETVKSEVKGKKDKDNSISEGTLIISNDEDIEVNSEDLTLEKHAESPDKTTKKLTSSTKSPKKSDDKPKSGDKSKKDAKETTDKQAEAKATESAHVWVSDISRTVKATDLKKHLAQFGKVITSKIVTNGKLFFGYVQFESAESAATCMKKLDNTTFEGKKISVSRSKPDLHKKDKEKDKQRSKDGETDRRKTDRVKKDDPLTMKCDEPRRRTKIEEELWKDLDRSRIESRNLRRRLMNEEKKYKAEKIRCERLENDMRDLNFKLKSERRTYDLEIVKLKKKLRLEQDKIDLERSQLNKEKEELKKRQAEFDRELKRLDETKKTLERIKRARKSRSISPRASSKRFRGDVYPERSPPPPPKLSDSRAKHSSERVYYEEKKRAIYERLGDYQDKSSYTKESSRHRTYPAEIKSAVVPPQKAWATSPQQQDSSWKRSGSAQSFSKPFMDHYNNSSGGYQKPPMSYYPNSNSDYSKHGHYDNMRKY